MNAKIRRIAESVDWPAAAWSHLLDMMGSGDVDRGRPICVEAEELDLDALRSAIVRDFVAQAEYPDVVTALECK